MLRGTMKLGIFLLPAVGVVIPDGLTQSRGAHLQLMSQSFNILSLRNPPLFNFQPIVLAPPVETIKHRSVEH